MRKSFSVRTDIPQKVPIVFKKRAGDLFMFEIKKECTNFLRNVQKGLKIVQNLDTRLLCFLRQKCAYFAIFGTQLHIYCDFFYWNLKELQDPWWRIWPLNDSAIFGIHSTSQKKERKFFCLPLPPIFNLRWFECLLFDEGPLTCWMSVLRVPSLAGCQFLEGPLTCLDVMWSLFWSKLDLKMKIWPTSGRFGENCLLKLVLVCLILTQWWNKKMTLLPL